MRFDGVGGCRKGGGNNGVINGKAFRLSFKEMGY